MTLTANNTSVTPAARLIPVRTDAADEDHSRDLIAVLGDMTPLTRRVRDADQKGETVYVNRRNVAYVAPRGSGCFVHLVGGGSIEVVESAREAAAMLS